MTLEEANQIAKLCYWIVGSIGWTLGIVCMVKYVIHG